MEGEEGVLVLFLEGWRFSEEARVLTWWREAGSVKRGFGEDSGSTGDMGGGGYAEAGVRDLGDSIEGVGLETIWNSYREVKEESLINEEFATGD